VRMKLASRGERWWFVLSHMAALAVGLFAAYAALEHNPQEEFCTYVASGAFANYVAYGDPCLINWVAVSWVFIPWLAITAAALFYAPFALWKLTRGEKTAL